MNQSSKAHKKIGMAYVFKIYGSINKMFNSLYVYIVSYFAALLVFFLSYLV
jgi:hypothetical protein